MHGRTHLCPALSGGPFVYLSRSLRLLSDYGPHPRFEPSAGFAAWASVLADVARLQATWRKGDPRLRYARQLGERPERTVTADARHQPPAPSR